MEEHQVVAVHDLALVRRPEHPGEVVRGPAQEAPHHGGVVVFQPPGNSEPLTRAIPAGSNEARRSVTARTAPSSRCSLPFASVAWASQSSRVGRRFPVGWNRVPTGSF